MKKRKITRLLASAVFFATIAFSAQAQVTVGSDIPATRGALLELKTQQTTGSVSNVLNAENVTSTTGGLLLPRVQLVSTNTMEPFIPTDDDEWMNNTNSLKEKLAGLMVYNLTVDNGLYPGVYTWDGAQWTTSQINTVAELYVSAQPQAFTFYETFVSGASVVPLFFGVSGGVAPITYQWYQVTGNNVHIRIGTPVSSGTGGTTASYTPMQVKVGDGDTRYASRNGFYRFYCVATDGADRKIESATAEVAVGCGAKNNAGEWLSFMCFNLGADNNSTIAYQKNYTFSPGFTNESNGKHTYVASEEDLFGDLFQWGRIPDGHEKRQSSAISFGTMTTDEIVNGARCSVSDVQRPFNQVKKTSAWFGKFILSTSVTEYNWYPGTSQSTADQLWRAGRFVQNDPCAHYKADGSYQEFWHEGANEMPDSEACTDAGTGWRMPNQQEWGDIYRGGTLSGHPDLATANTWKWLNEKGGTADLVTNSRGFEIMPDGMTTTLFLPATGNRNYSNASLFSQGEIGSYCSITVAGTQSYLLNFVFSNVNPARSNYRAYGFAVRCIKH